MFNSVGLKLLHGGKQKKRSMYRQLRVPATPNLGYRGFGGGMFLFFIRFPNLHCRFFFLHLHPVSRYVSSRLALDSSGLIDGE